MNPIKIQMAGLILASSFTTTYASNLDSTLSSTLCAQSNLPAYSLGSTGYRLGYAITELSSDFDTSPYLGGSKQSSNISRIQFSKGTPLPINMGFQFGASENAQVFQQGAHLTWTAYESPGLPNITLRYSHDQLKGFRKLSVESQTASIGFEYSPIYWVSLASYRNLHKSSVDYLTNSDGEQWGIRDRELDQQVSTNTNNSSNSYRVQVKPFTQSQIYISLERKEFGSGNAANSIMISSGF